MREAYRSGTREFVTVEKVKGEIFIGAVRVPEMRIRETAARLIRTNWLPVLIGLTVFLLGLTMGLKLKH